MDEKPSIIEKRLLTCKKCGYNVQLYGEMYFDYGCYNYIGTFLCKNCQTLFEDLISKIDEWDTVGDFIYNLQDVQTCLKCGSNKCTVWNIESGKCPKCQGAMDCVIFGKIQLKHTNT